VQDQEKVQNLKDFILMNVRKKEYNNMNLDIVSDLHVDQWSDKIEWQGLPTSLVAIIAGDISTDIRTTYETVVDIGRHYRHTIFVDGNHEHANSIGIKDNNRQLHDLFAKHSNITFLNKNSLVLDDVAFIGSNGWWTYDFSTLGRSACFNQLIDQGWPKEVLFEQFEQAEQDAAGLKSLVELFDKDASVKKIVIVTHTIPSPEFKYITPDQLDSAYGRNGSSFMSGVFTKNKKEKLCAWVFGHVHRSYDVMKNGVHYVSNPRGTPTNGARVYYPKILNI
jgi:Icc-related predicted phosphoesterase